MYSGGAGPGREIGFIAATQAILMNNLGAARYLTHIGVTELSAAMLFSLGLGGPIHWERGNGGYGVLTTTANELLVGPLVNMVGAMLNSKRINTSPDAVPVVSQVRIAELPGLQRAAGHSRRPASVSCCRWWVL